MSFAELVDKIIQYCILLFGGKWNAHWCPDVEFVRGIRVQD